MSLNKNKLLTSPIFVALGAILCCALWGSATPFIKIGYAVMFPDGKPNIPSTILFAGIRFAFAGFLTILIYSIARKRVLLPKRENLGRIGIIALLQTVIQYFFFYVGLANTSGEKGTILSGSSCFFAILISTLIFKQEKLTPKKIIACILGFSGMVVANLNGLDLSMNLMGDGFVIFSAISLGFSSVMIKIFSKREDPVVISGYQFMAGGVVMVIVGLILGGKVDLSSLKGILVLIYLSCLSAVAYALWGVLLKHNPVSRVTIFSFMTPVFGVILTKLMLPEKANISVLNMIISLLLVCAGVLLLNYVPKFKSANKSLQTKDEK
jgi:drug/metabolite transporter (DMT)-like permease